MFPGPIGPPRIGLGQRLIQTVETCFSQRIRREKSCETISEKYVDIDVTNMTDEQYETYLADFEVDARTWWRQSC